MDISFAFLVNGHLKLRNVINLWRVASLMSGRAAEVWTLVSGPCSLHSTGGSPTVTGTVIVVGCVQHSDSWGPTPGFFVKPTVTVALMEVTHTLILRNTILQHTYLLLGHIRAFSQAF